MKNSSTMQEIGRNVVLVAIVLFMPVSLTASAPPSFSFDMLQMGRPLPRADMLVPGIHRYARFMVSGESRKLIDLWTMSLSYDEKNGRRVLHIVQRLEAADKSYVADFDQTFEATTFKPLAQSQKGTRNGLPYVMSVIFDGAHVDSISDDLTGHEKPLHKKFHMAFYNWYTDTELLQSLPLKKGYAVSIPFYDVGQEPPARYTYVVVGDEKLPSPDGGAIDCWVMVLKSDPANPPLRFWFAKRNQVLVREEATVPGEGTLVKALLMQGSH